MKNESMKLYIDGSYISVNFELNDVKVLDIRKKHSEGILAKELSAMFGVTDDNIRRIIRRDTWRYI